MRLPRTQRGLTIWGWIAVLLVGGFFVTVGLKVVPGYLEYFKVAETFEKIRTEGKDGMSSREIRKNFDRRFSIEDVDTITWSDIKIEAKRGRIQDVWVDYEYRRHLFYNIDVVLKFHKEMQVPMP